MAVTGLNVCVGIDAGSKTSKLAYDSKIISELEGFNALELREEAEIYFDEPVFACVVAIPDNSTYRQKEDIIFYSKKAGFTNVNIITKSEAVKSLNYEGKILIYDLGASKSDIAVFNDGEILENEIIEDVCGNEFDKIFSEWLSERFTLNLIDKKVLMDKAEKMKISLTYNDYVTWRDVKIFREDFERLIYFTVKRASHFVKKFQRIYKPERFILTGGCSRLPIMRKIFGNAEIIENIISKGASIKAASLSKDKNKTSERLNTAAKIRELKLKLIEIEELLTRKQKDRLYLLFKNAERIAVSEPKILILIENLISEIKTQKG